MNSKNASIVKKYLWSATTIGLVLGPGADATPLAMLWAAGFTHLASEANLKFETKDVTSAIASIIAVLGAWFVSGKVAQCVAGTLTASGLGLLGVTGGLSLLLALLATLSLNATINALFTYRFLNAVASILEDRSFCGTIFIKAYINYITEQLLTLAEIPGDLVKTAKLMFR